MTKGVGRVVYCLRRACIKLFTPFRSCNISIFIKLYTPPRVMQARLPSYSRSDSDTDPAVPSANCRQAGSHLRARLLGNKERQWECVCVCMRKPGKWRQRKKKNSHVVAKRRGEIWARWLNCISQIACHSRSTGDEFDLIQLIMQAKRLNWGFVLHGTGLAWGIIG